MVASPAGRDCSLGALLRERKVTTAALKALRCSASGGGVDFVIILLPRAALFIRREGGSEAKASMLASHPPQTAPDFPMRIHRTMHPRPAGHTHRHSCSPSPTRTVPTAYSVLPSYFPAPESTPVPSSRRRVHLPAQPFPPCVPYRPRPPPADYRETDSPGCRPWKTAKRSIRMSMR